MSGSFFFKKLINVNFTLKYYTYFCFIFINFINIFVNSQHVLLKNVFNILTIRSTNNKWCEIKIENTHSVSINANIKW